MAPSESRSRESEKAAPQFQLKGEGSGAGPSPLSSEPLAPLAPLGEALLVLTLAYLLSLEGPFTGIIHQFLLLFAGPLAFLQRLAGLRGGHQLARQQPLSALMNCLQP